MNRWRPRWSQVAAALALVAAIAIAAPAIGGEGATIALKKKALKKLIRKEVAKRIASATGPPGANGLNGLNGGNGADGTARAYARVRSHFFDNCAGGCTFDRSKGITSVIRSGVGNYCVTAPGISPDSVAPAVTVYFFDTAPPEGNASAMAAGTCLGSGFEVQTEFQPIVSVRNAADTGSTQVSDTAVVSDEVSFTIVIP